MMLFGVTGSLGLSPEPDGFATRRTPAATVSRRWV